MGEKSFHKSTWAKGEKHSIFATRVLEAFCTHTVAGWHTCPVEEHKCNLGRASAPGVNMIGRQRNAQALSGSGKENRRPYPSPEGEASPLSSSHEAPITISRLKIKTHSRYLSTRYDKKGIEYWKKKNMKKWWFDKWAFQCFFEMAEGTPMSSPLKLARKATAARHSTPP